MNEEHLSPEPDELDNNEHSTEKPRNQQRRRCHAAKPFPIMLVAGILFIMALSAIGYMLARGGVLPGQDLEVLRRIQKGLRFHLVTDQAINAKQLEPINPETELVLFSPSAKAHSVMYYKLNKAPAITGAEIKEAALDKDELGSTLIRISFDSAGSEQFADFTAKHIGEQLAIVYGDRIITAPVIQSRITGGQAQITGRNIEFILEDIRNAEEKSSSEVALPEKE